MMESNVESNSSTPLLACESSKNFHPVTHMLPPYSVESSTKPPPAYDDVMSVSITSQSSAPPPGPPPYSNIDNPHQVMLFVQNPSFPSSAILSAIPIDQQQLRGENLSRHLGHQQLLCDERFDRQHEETQIYRASHNNNRCTHRRSANSSFRSNAANKAKCTG